MCVQGAICEKTRGGDNFEKPFYSEKLPHNGGPTVGYMKTVVSCVTLTPGVLKLFSQSPDLIFIQG